MANEVIKIGDKVDIRISLEVDKAKDSGEPVRVFKSQVLDIKEDGELELAMPFDGTKVVLLPLDLRYEFVFSGNGGMFKAEGQVKERYKADNRFMILVEMVSELEKFQRRAFFRLDADIDVFYWKITDEQAKYTNYDHILQELRMNPELNKRRKARTVDISGGGARIRTDEEFTINQFLLLTFQLKHENKTEQVTVPAQVLQVERAEDRGMRAFESRLMFLVKDHEISESIIRYIFSEERKNRKVRR